MEHILVRTIDLKTLDNLMQFCLLSETLEGEVTARQGKYVVNGKSIMGLMSLNLLSPIIVEYETGSYNFDNFLNSLEVV